MLKKSMLVLSLATILIAGCAQEKPKAQDQPLPQAKPPVQVEQKQKPNTNKPKIVGKTKFDNEMVDVEERIKKVKDFDGKMVEVKEYYQAGTNNRIFGFRPNQNTTSEPLKNEGKKVTKFKSK